MERERCGHKEMWVIGDGRAMDNQLIGAEGDEDDDVWTKMGCSTTTTYYYSLIFQPFCSVFGHRCFSEVIAFESTDSLLIWRECCVPVESSLQEIENTMCGFELALYHQRTS